MLIWPPAGEQFEKDRTQCVHIAHGRHGLIAQLLRACIGRRRHHCRCKKTVGLNQLGSAEIQQLDCAFGLGDQNVGRLQVQVNDQIAVCIGNGFADPYKKLQSFRDAETALIAVGVEVHPVDILHHEVRLACIGESRIEHAGDVRVVERSEDMLFAGEALGKERPCRPSRKDLQRGALHRPADHPLH